MILINRDLLEQVQQQMRDLLNNWKEISDYYPLTALCKESGINPHTLAGFRRGRFLSFEKLWLVQKVVLERKIIKPEDIQLMVLAPRTLPKRED